MDTSKFLLMVEAFNKEAGLLQRGFNASREASFLVEEALEGLPLETVADSLVETPVPPTAKTLARTILQGTEDSKITLVDALDKAGDAIVFAVGSMLKAGLDATQVEDVLCIIAEANMQKLVAKVDAFGKLGKNEDFIPPEETIIEYLKTFGIDGNKVI